MEGLSVATKGLIAGGGMTRASAGIILGGYGWFKEFVWREIKRFVSIVTLTKSFKSKVY